MGSNLHAVRRTPWNEYGRRMEWPGSATLQAVGIGGFISDAFTLSPVGEHLNERFGAHVVVRALPAHESVSALSRAHLGHFPSEVVSIVRSEITSLASRNILFGYSAGALAAQCAAAEMVKERRESIAGLVLISPSYHLASPNSRARGDLLRFGYNAPMLIGALFDIYRLIRKPRSATPWFTTAGICARYAMRQIHLPRHEPVAQYDYMGEVVQAASMTKIPIIAAATLPSLQRAAERCLPCLESYNVPILVVIGDDDPVIDRAMVGDAVSCFSNVIVKRVAGGHSMWRQSGQALEVITRFCSNVWNISRMRSDDYLNADARVSA
jgi:pimeloyl-ACP methyl ester carboxylesterase